MSFLQNLFGGGPKVDFNELIGKGAVIIDVRTVKEFQTGHVKKSKNIPLSELPSSLSKLDKRKTIITCCATGARSASARRFLLSNGFTEVYNGGSWTNLENL
jgi:phage shock protein E